MNNWRNDFPIFSHLYKGKQLIYFDSAATSQKPQMVIDAITKFYTEQNSNIHRGIYAFGEEVTTLYENARAKVAAFINAEPDEIIFTKGTTEGINFVASTWAAQHIGTDDEILLTQMEHHSNLIPWQIRAKAQKAHLNFIPVKQDGTLDLAPLSRLITQKTKLVCVIHVSNVTGARNDLAAIIAAAQKVRARVLIDAAQSIPHQKIDVKKLNCDFLAFSGHKIFGPTGIGVLYIKRDLHAQIEPYQFGGGMVYEADFNHASWQKPPHKFEAGTPPIAQAIGLGTAIDYFKNNVNVAALQKHEAQLCAQLIEGLEKHLRIKIIGPQEQLKREGHLVSFIVDGMHAHDVAAHLSKENICVRAGNHCAQPLAKALGISATVRASFYAYNTPGEVEKFLKAITLL